MMPLFRLGVSLVYVLCKLREACKLEKTKIAFQRVFRFHMRAHSRGHDVRRRRIDAEFDSSHSASLAEREPSLRRGEPRRCRGAFSYAASFCTECKFRIVFFREQPILKGIADTSHYFSALQAAASC
jgi:hypothetical protein